MLKLNEFRLIGVVKSILFECRSKKGSDQTVPVCEIELDVPNGNPETLKCVAFYDKAEEVAALIVENDRVLVRGRLRGQKSSYQGKTQYIIELWCNDIQKDGEPPCK